MILLFPRSLEEIRFNENIWLFLHILDKQLLFLRSEQVLRTQNWIRHPPWSWCKPPFIMQWKVMYYWQNRILWNHREKSLTFGDLNRILQVVNACIRSLFFTRMNMASKAFQATTATHESATSYERTNIQKIKLVHQSWNFHWKCEKRQR